jgi:hypothetical protein
MLSASKGFGEDHAERLQKLSEKDLQALKDGVTSLIVLPSSCVSDPIWMSYEKDRGDN